MAKIYVDLNENNELNGFYTEGLHNAIPETAIEINEETRDLIISQHKKFKVIDVTKDIDLDNLEEIVVDVKEKPTSFAEQLRADVDFIMIMEGYADV